MTRSTPLRAGGAVQGLASRLQTARKPAVDVPVENFRGFLQESARVRMRDGSYGPFSFEGRRPLVFISELLDAIVRNCVHQEAVEIDGIQYDAGKLKGATLSVCGGAQFGKTVIELNLGGFVTTVELLNFGYYTSDRELLATIVDTKFRPDVVDQIPWIRDMCQLGKVQSKSGKSVERKNAFQVTAANGRKAFGYFNGMQKPPTTISLDVAVLDEVDDIPERNIGFVAGRMTNSDVQLTCYIGTQRIHSAGQNARWKAGTMHTWTVTCPACRAALCLEEHWPGISRIAVDGKPRRTDPKLDETMQFDPDAHYYPACPDCGAPLDPDAGAYVPQRPERARQRNWSIRVSQLDIPALAWRDVVAAWFAALADPNPEAMAAWHCDRLAIPHAGAQQPITPDVLGRARRLALSRVEGAEPVQPYCMTLAWQGPRVAGMDMGPRCWMWVNGILDPQISPLLWAEMIPSGSAFSRIAELYAAGVFGCIFLDAGGEPDLTKRIVLALNGLDQYSPPVVPAADLRGMQLGNIGAGCTWDGALGQWRGIKAAAVEFSLREAGGVQQCVGLTQEGRIYPLIKANRGETIQGFVNDFLTPKEGVIQQVSAAPGMTPAMSLRLLPRQRLPGNCLGAGVTESMLDAHLQNLRRIKDPRTGREDWAEQVENHLGLAGAYARLAGMLTLGQAVPTAGRIHVLDTRRTRAVRERRNREVLA